MNLPMSDFGVTWTLLLILYHVGESWVWCSLEYLVGTYRKTVSHQAVKQNCPKLVADNTIQWWQMPLSQSNFLLGRWKLMANKSRQVTFSLWWKITYNFGDQPSRKNETADICPSYLWTPRSPRPPPPPALGHVANNSLSASAGHTELVVCGHEGM